jgi:hypothetical protein
MSTVFNCTKLHFSMCNGSLVLSIKITPMRTVGPNQGVKRGWGVTLTVHPI